MDIKPLYQKEKKKKEKKSTKINLLFEISVER